jgi:hypothetical protein
MKTTMMIFGLTLGLCGQDLTPEQALKLDLAKKKLDEAQVRITDQTFQFVTGQLLSAKKAVKGQPYSAEAVNESTQVLADGNRIVNRTASMIYRDSEGRERREESIAKLGPWHADGEPAKAIFISDPVAKTSYTLDEKSHTASKSLPGLSTVTVAPPGGRGGNVAFSQRVESSSGDLGVFKYEARSIGSGETPAKIEHLGTQVIEGIAAEGTRETITIPAGQIGNDREMKIVSERWYSPELQVTVMSKHSDPRMGDTVYKLTNINRAEPMHSLFEVPPDYTISDPGSLRRMKITKDENQF